MLDVDTTGAVEKQTMTFTVRPARPDDAAAACEVLRRSIREVCVADHRHDPAILQAWLANKTPGNVQAWIESPRGFTVVAEAGQGIVGVARLGGDGRVVLCYAVPEVLRRGVGKAMIAALEAEARVRGVKVLELESTRTARDFYRRNGFTETGEGAGMFGVVAVAMCKKLTSPPMD
jgi:GNAT superfamily N-acetyltransferase